MADLIQREPYRARSVPLELSTALRRYLLQEFQSIERALTPSNLPAPVFNVQDTQWAGGMKTDGSDCTPAWNAIHQALVTAGRGTLYATGGDYRFATAPSTIASSNAVWQGIGGRGTRFYRDFGGTGAFFPITANLWRISGLYLDGGGSTAPLLDVTSGNNWTIRDLETTNAGGVALRIAADAGQFCHVSDVVMPGTTASIQINGTDSIIGSRHFTNVDTGGGTIDIGGAQTTFLIGCQLNALTMTSASKKLIATGCRIQNGVAGPLTVSGIDHNLIGMVTANSITLDASTASCMVIGEFTGVSDLGTNNTILTSALLKLIGPANVSTGGYQVNGTKVVGAQQAANPDTSGATLVQLETEVNEVKTALRAHGLIA